jgi:hypothetical protein
MAPAKTQSTPVLRKDQVANEKSPADQFAAKGEFAYIEATKFRAA